MDMDERTINRYLEMMTCVVVSSAVEIKNLTSISISLLLLVCVYVCVLGGGWMGDATVDLMHTRGYTCGGFDVGMPHYQLTTRVS